MAIKKTELIILRRVPVQDSSLFLISLSRDYGKLLLVAKGATRPGSTLAEALQYFTVADIVFYQREQSAADYISKADIKEFFGAITLDVNKFGYASAGLELVNLFLPEREENRQVYFTLKKYLRLLDGAGGRDFRRELLHFWYLLCIFSGYAPELERCVVSGRPVTGARVSFDPERGGVVGRAPVGDKPTLQLDRGTVMALKKLAVTPISDSRKVTLSQEQEVQILSLLTALTEFHIGKRADLKSFDFLRKLKRQFEDGGESGSDG